MQSQSTAVFSSCCGNLHHAQQLAARGVQWLFEYLPCVKGHHRVHPASFETPDASYIVIDAKKRLRILHIIPNSSNLTPTVKTDYPDHVDAGDHCSLDSSGEDYWFMRWSRPIRPNLLRRSCNCSFRRSQIKSDLGLQLDSKPAGCNNESSVIPQPSEETSKSFQEKLVDGSLHSLAEQLSRNIVSEAVQESLEIETSVNNHSNKSLTGSKALGDISTKYCDNVSVNDVKLSVKKSDVEFCGYVNPVFIASNDALHLIPSDETQIHSCDNQCGGSKQDEVIKEHQDYNANDQSCHILQEISVSNNQNTNIQRNNVNGMKDDKKGHHKSCRVGTKSYLKKPVLLLIHGAGSSYEVWQNLIARLVQSGYECVAPDLLGHGLSSAPDNANYYTFHSFLQHLLCVFDRYVTEGRTAVILGHGYGCSLAAAIARYRPEQVVQLVLISGGGPTPLAPRTPPSVSPCLRVCLEPLLMCGFKRDVVYSVCGKQMVPISPETSAVPRHIIQHIAQGHIWPEGDAAFHRRIVAPTLLVHGMRDQHVTLVQQCEMERTIPRSFLEVIPEAGHWAMLETPSHLSHMILCFIDWWAPPNSTQ